MATGSTMAAKAVGAKVARIALDGLRHERMGARWSIRQQSLLLNANI